MEEVAEKLADIFSVFSNAKRVLIFWTLDGTEKSVNDIARSIDASSSMSTVGSGARPVRSHEIRGLKPGPTRAHLRPRDQPGDYAPRWQRLLS